MNSLADLAALLKRKGFTVGLTNGCFDLLHEGHRHLFKECLKHCDILFVAINDDESVKALKGKDRPVDTLEVRVEKLKKTGLVHAIAPFTAEAELLEIIQDIKPDMLIKGSDYAGRLITGDTFVKGKGGKVVLIPLLAGFSTTAKLH